MSITEAKLFRYCLPLKRPIAVRGQAYRNREGLVLRLTNESGKSAFGEIAALPGYSAETHEDALVALRSVAKDLTNHRPFRFDGVLSARVPPSVCFGVEAALWILGELQFSGLPSYSNCAAPVPLPVNALVELADNRCAGAVRSALDNGYGCIKFKAGRQPLERDIQGLNEIMSNIPRSVAVRVDCNRSWSIDGFARFADSVNSERIEYIEEPLGGPDDYRFLPPQVNTPVALDESLAQVSANALDSIPNLAALVIKPTMLGLNRSLELIQTARRRSLVVTLSSCFESSVGISTIAQLAIALGTAGSASGLDTVSWYERDLVKERLEIQSGHLIVPKLDSLEERLDYSLLSEVPLV